MEQLIQRLIHMSDATFWDNSETLMNKDTPIVKTNIFLKGEEKQIIITNIDNIDKEYYGKDGTYITFGMCNRNGNVTAGITYINKYGELERYLIDLPEDVVKNYIRLSEMAIETDYSKYRS